MLSMNLQTKLDIQKRVVIDKSDNFKLYNGLYLFYRVHGGHIVQTKVYLIALNDYIENNNFFRPKNLIQEYDNNAYALEYNPYNGIIRLINEQTDNIASYYYIKIC